MDRDKFIHFLTLYHNGGVDMNNSKQFLIDYCIERGKKYDSNMEKFVNLALIYSPYYLSYAIQWYKIKFQINELFKVLPNGERQIILIY